MPYNLNPMTRHVKVSIGETDALMTFKQPSPVALRNYYREVRPTYKARQRDMKMIPADRAPANKLLADHLVVVQNVLANGELELFEDPLDVIVRQLTAPRAQGVVTNLIGGGLLNLTPLEKEPDELPPLATSDTPAKPSKLTFGSLFASEPTYFEITQWDGKTGEKSAVQIKITMHEASAKQQRQLELAQPLVRKGGSGNVEQEEDPVTIQRIFEERVTEIDNAEFYLNGVVMDGDAEAVPKPCEPDLQAEWARLVPYHLVAAALAEDQVRSSVGND